MGTKANRPHRDRALARSARSESHLGELFHLMIDSIRDYAIFMLDPTGHVMTWNAGAERIKGYGADEIIGRHFSIFYSAEETRSGKPEYELRTAIEQGRYEDEGWRLRQDGSRFWANVIITPVHNPAGELLGFAKLTRDLTERKQAEDERAMLLAAEHASRVDAEQARARLEAIQSVTMVGPVADLQLLLDTVVPRVAELLSADTASILLEEAGDLVLAVSFGLESDVESGVRVPLGQGFAGRVAAESRTIAIDDATFYDVDGPAITPKGVTSLLGTPLMAEGTLIGVVHVGNLRYRRFTEDDSQLLEMVADRIALAIAHARSIEAEGIARAEALAAQKSARQRDEFMAVAAHELKTPLTGLRIGVQLAARRLAAAGPEAAAASAVLNPVLGQADRVHRLMIQLLEASRLEEGRFTLEPQEIDMSALVREAVQTARATSGRDIEVVVPEALSARVDPLRLEQVVVNLVDNALKYSPAEAAPVEVHLRRDIGSLVLTVRDYGTGVPPELRGHLFERFYQARSGTYHSGWGWACMSAEASWTPTAARSRRSFSTAAAVVSSSASPTRYWRYAYIALRI